MPGPQVCGGGCLRVVTRGWVLAGGFAGRRGRRPLRFARGMGGSGRSPLIRPCGATFPRGGRQGLQGRDSSLLGKDGSGRSRRGGGTPPYVWGDMETPWGLREQSFPGRRAVGAGHARPGGLRRQASLVRSVGRGLDPSAGGCPGDGRWREFSRGVGDAAPYGLPGEGRQRKPAPHPALRGHLPPGGKARAAGEGFIPPGEGRQRKVAAGWGHPALRMGIWKRCGVYVGNRFRAAAR